MFINLDFTQTSGDSNFKAMKSALPPTWVEDIEKVEEDINKINKKGAIYYIKNILTMLSH
jgi:hypothetical protein